MSQKLSSILWKGGFRSLLIGFLVLNVFVFSFFFQEINDMYRRLTTYTAKITTLSQELIEEKQKQLKTISNDIKPHITEIIDQHNTLAETLITPRSTPNIINDFKKQLSNELNDTLKVLTEKYNISSACVCNKFGTIMGQYGLDNYDYIDMDLVETTKTLSENQGSFGISPNGINYVIKLPANFECFLIIFKPTQLHIFKDFNIFNRINEKANNLKIYWYVFVLLVFLALIGIFLFFSSHITKKVSASILTNLNKLLEVANKIHNNKLEKQPHLEITEFQNIAEILQENQENINTINHILQEKNAFINELDNISTGIILLSQTNEIIFINGQAAKMLCNTENACISKHIEELLPEIEGFLENMEPKQVDKFNHRLLIKFNKVDEKILINLEDITYQISLQKQAAWRDVARVIAHEVKNPLTPTRLCAEQLLHHPDLARDRQEKYLNTIINNVEHVNKLINDFTDFTKQTQQTLNITEFSLKELIEEIIQTSKLTHPQINYILDINKDIKVQADRKQITQALSNLMQNAAQAMDTEEPEPHIIIKFSKDADSCKIIIEDNGKGLATSADKLFQPYMTTKTYGTGLGLVVVKKIAQTHGGTAILEPLEKGAKAMFIMSLKTIE